MWLLLEQKPAAQPTDEAETCTNPAGDLNPFYQHKGRFPKGERLFGSKLSHTKIYSQYTPRLRIDAPHSPSYKRRDGAQTPKAISE